MENSLREYVNREGESELRVNFDADSVKIEDSDKHEIVVSNEQARWLATELDQQFGGGSKRAILEDRILFCTGAFDERTVIDIQKDLMRLADKWLRRKTDDRGHLTLFINSPGGPCSHGLALIDNIHYIRGLGIPVIGVVQGVGYSMGSIVLQACTQRFLTRHARLMLHEVFSGGIGKVHDLEESLKEVKNVQRILAEILAERNTAGHNDPKYWEEFFKPKDRFLSPQECVELGLCDAIYDPLKQYEFEIDGA